MTSKIKIVAINEPSTPKKVSVRYPESVLANFTRAICEQALSTGAEIIGAWLGARVCTENEVQLLAIKPLILEPISSSGSHVCISGEVILHLEKIALNDGLSLVVIAHTHNWRGGERLFSSIDTATAKSLFDPLLAFATIDPYTGSIKHWRIVDDAIEPLDQHIISDEVAILTKDGVVTPIIEDKEIYEDQEIIRKLESSIKMIDTGLRFLSIGIHNFNDAIELISSEADRALLSLGPKLLKKRKLLLKTLRKMEYDK